MDRPTGTVKSGVKRSRDDLESDNVASGDNQAGVNRSEQNKKDKLESPGNCTGRHGFIERASLDGGERGSVNTVNNSCNIDKQINANIVYLSESARHTNFNAEQTNSIERTTVIEFKKLFTSNVLKHHNFIAIPASRQRAKLSDAVLNLKMYPIEKREHIVENEKLENIVYLIRILIIPCSKF